MPATPPSVLSLNSGSSSLKFGVFQQAPSGVNATFRGLIEGIGLQQGRLSIRAGDDSQLVDEPQRNAAQSDAIRALRKALTNLHLPELAGIGHRIVHGGPFLREHQRLTPEVLHQLENAAPFAPLHVPVALSLVREIESEYPGVPQIACFDTAFHRTLPEAAARFALPQQLWADGIRRYGFHGISCESILHTLGDDLRPRTVIAHLGNGASITAVADGASVDTSMGLSPTGGIIMGSRTGDLDPGVLLYLLRTSDVNAAELEKLFDKRAGLLGISGVSSDLRQLHKAAPDNPRARLAIEMFCRTAKKTISAYAAVLGGLDLLVFSAGIGEHDPIVRSKICEGLEFLGLSLDSDRNSRNQAIISRADSPVSIRIIRADEETQIARHVFRLLM
jgi:acetate kinase